MNDVSRLGLALLIVVASVYVLTSARPQIGNAFQRWSLTAQQSRVIGIFGLVLAFGLLVSTLL